VQQIQPATCCLKRPRQNVAHRGTAPRSWSAPPIGRKPVTLIDAALRIGCRDQSTHRLMRCQDSAPGTLMSRC